MKGLIEHMRVNTLLQDVTHWYVAPSSGDEPATMDPESGALTRVSTLDSLLHQGVITQDALNKY
jgi:hypothetical protein